ncbi:hypothetical protein ACGFZK_10440 [Streptomyces sp. NPDC048257]|uniref:hypothetical protein n=1 Tax=Streptomyces sp. NPDC048257 TaxID=3365526 RepID=UPI003715E3AE
MSMPPPQQPPGPYGPPQPPNPYGAQPYAAQPAHQQPYPAQAAWGQHPMGTPPRKRRTGMVIGIVAASLVALGVVGVLVSVAGGSGFPEARYRLIVPKTVVDGKYELVQDLSATEGKKALKGSYDSKIRNPEPVVGQYTSTSSKGASALVFSGMYGQFKDPASARRKMLDGAADSEGAFLAVPARDVTPTGSGITLSCEVLTMTQGSAQSSLPICAWADENTGASVGFVTPETAQQKPEAVDLVKIAEATLKVRAESRQPIG